MAPRPSAPPPDGHAVEEKLRGAALARLRQQAADQGLRDKLRQAAGAGGQDPYAVLAQAISRLLREG